MTINKLLSASRRVWLTAILASATVLLTALIAAPAAFALGDNDDGVDDGICDYSDEMRMALLEHFDKRHYQCNDEPFNINNENVWGKANVDLKIGPVDGVFAPGQGELDGYFPGARIDLRDSGVDIDEIDLTEALKTFDAEANYQIFGEDVKGDEDVLGLTFLLDGRDSNVNGLVDDKYSGTEGEISFFTFTFDRKPQEFSNLRGPDTEDDGLYLVVELVVEDSEGDRNLFFAINNRDSDGTLYVIPYLSHDDEVIEDDETNDVLVNLVGVFDSPADFPSSSHTFDDEDDFDRIVDSIDNEEADFELADDDSPAVDVCDRSDEIVSALEDVFVIDCDEISVSDLAGLDRLELGSLDIESLAVGDFDGLTGLGELDLTDNELSSLPTGLFADVGIDVPAPQTVFIDLAGNNGPRGGGFALRNVSRSFRNSVTDRQAIRLRDFANNEEPDYGFDARSVSVGEDSGLTLSVTVPDDSAVIFRNLGDTGTYEDLDSDCPAPCEAPDSVLIDFAGEYLLGLYVPASDDNEDDTFTGLLGESVDGETLTSIFGVMTLTITDDTPAPVVETPFFSSITVTGQPRFVDEPNNFDLAHNLADFAVPIDGRRLQANFKSFYESTGDLKRWGYPTSEVLIIEDRTLTQFFQRGVIDFHNVGSGWLVERRLAWDYFGGGIGGSVDQGVEPAPATPPAGGVVVGAFRHYVANVTADGQTTGFLDFFNELGGIDSFGFPKTEGRVDTGADDTLFEGKTAGFVRQYFQAAVFQLSANDGVQLTLLGDTLRNALVPNHASLAPFRRASVLQQGDDVTPIRV